MNNTAPVITRAGLGSASGIADADPVTTEIVRHALNSAAKQMMQALIRTSFSPMIYEILDFAAAIYDAEIRMLAQAPSSPVFMGTMNFCVEEAVKGVGGVDILEPGDIILYNWPYGTGSHAQDAALVMPAFHGKMLVGYATIKAHWLDIGGKEPYSTDTIDVFQEGTFFPGIKLYRCGVLVDDIWRIILANSRVPDAIAGDIKAQVVGVRTGAEGLLRIVERFGLQDFLACVERIYDHGEAVVRGYFEKIPDGRYVGQGITDDNGIDDVPVPFEVAIEVHGPDVTIDFTNSPQAQPGPINCPLPSTVSASRVAIAMLAGGCELPCEGHFRPVEIITRPGSLFHPLPPAPCFLYGWPALQAMDVMYEAISKAMPDAVPACSGGDICGLVWWGERKANGEPWADGAGHPIGQGAHAFGDGSNALMHIAESSARLTSSEVWEVRNPWLMDRVELNPDTGGPGMHRGGLGMIMNFRILEDTYVTASLERTKTPPWGLCGGLAGVPNDTIVTFPDGTRQRIAKVTGLMLPEGSVLELRCGGGGGYGRPADRDPHAVREDLREGYVTETQARKHYPHAFDASGVAAQ